MKIAVYCIAKNEQLNVPGWFESIGDDADYIVFVDTGSTDKTWDIVGICTEAIYGRQGRNDFLTTVRPHQIFIDPWRFDDAHNAALALVPSDVDVCIPLALDERLPKNWRKLIEAKWQPRHTKACYTYQFSPNYSFTHDRIHARRGYRWRYPAHEGVYPYGATDERVVAIPELVITQTQDDSVNRMDRDIKLLEMGIKEYPDHARTNFYYGRQLMYGGHHIEALHFLERYRTLKGTFPHEQRLVDKAIAQCRLALTKA